MALPPVVIDARFGDWAGVPSLARADGPTSPNAPVELREVRMRHDAPNVFFYLDFGREVVPQGLAGTVRIVLDADGDPATGKTVDGVPGADLALVLSPRVTARDGSVSTFGVGVEALGGSGDAVLPADTAGLIVAPSAASTRFELRVTRGVRIGSGGPYFRGRQVSGRVIVLDRDGKAAGETNVFRYALAPGAPRPTPAGQGALDPLRRAPGTAFRLLSWNVNGKGFIDHPEPFRRAIAALNPDVILLDEVLPEARPTVDSMLAHLPAPPGAPAWHVVFGQAGGRQRGVVATRLPVEMAQRMARVPYPDSIADILRGAPQAVASDVSVAEGVPTLGALVSLDGRRILVATVDLKCCGGGVGTVEDRTRNVEARAMADAVRDVVRHDAPGAVIIAGDYNLVGSPAPLRVMADGTDVDGSALAVADAPRLDGLTYATWMRPRSQFAPGRLDYHAYSDRTLRVARSFAFDAADLSPRWLAAHGLRPDDSVAASGHRPVVTDFAWAGPAR
jgi:endonuclease/exonuclease/phosphatase family metal-dependent hydrolase